ncbi:MAG: hypothetical protein KatS3mg115_1953 [Candidatus Poribacteria bacterium]|nr:MAG: hypothetical protein KatS3mg115_1953 [Candidatus Poribacteria bacterium]
MLPKPSPQQVAWQEAGLALFLHFGINTFTDREWGDGTEDPRLFAPTALDARQWASAAKALGFRYLILTAKHHDGFCLWPTQQTEHSVRRSEWKGGTGDVVAEVAEACAELGLKFGFYLSPWDRHEPTYGDSPAYNAFFRRQLEELCTGYGPIHEVWFDGACGEGPNGRRQEYDWQSYYAVVREHQPDALIAICGPDIRWVGNEEGVADETNWSVQEPHPTFHAGRRGPVWWPAECDVSIRPGWFYHAHEDGRIKSLGHLLDIYYKSVGRNAVLLLNVPPNREGRLPDPDLERLTAWKEALAGTFQQDLAAGCPVLSPHTRSGYYPEAVTDGEPNTCWAPEIGVATPTLEVNLREPKTFNRSLVQEFSPEGQHVEEYVLEAMQGGQWVPFARGTTIGHRKLDRFPQVRTDRVRLRILKARDYPRIRRIGLFQASEAEEQATAEFQQAGEEHR